MPQVLRHLPKTRRSLRKWKRSLPHSRAERMRGEKRKSEDVLVSWSRSDAEMDSVKVS